MPKKSPTDAKSVGTQTLFSISTMQQIIEFSLPQENYLEYLRLLRSHGIQVAYSYAIVVTSERYKSRKPLAEPRIGRAKRCN